MSILVEVVNASKKDLLFGVRKLIFPEKGMSILVEVVNASEKDLLFGARKLIFSGMHRLRFLSEASWETVIFAFFAIVFFIANSIPTYIHLFCIVVAEVFLLGFLWGEIVYSPHECELDFNTFILDIDVPLIGTFTPGYSESRSNIKKVVHPTSDICRIGASPSDIQLRRPILREDLTSLLATQSMYQQGKLVLVVVEYAEVVFSVVEYIY